MDAGPVREHVEAIREAGMPVHGICRVNGLTRGALDHLLWGSNMGDRGTRYEHGEKVRRELAEVLLAYWPSLDDFPDSARIEPCGFRRRLEALLVQGFTIRFLAQECGIGESTLQKARTADRVTAYVARAVREVYDRLWDQRPQDYGISDAVVGAQQRNHVWQGCLPALAWDDDTIDDPAAVPMLDAEEPEPCRDSNAVDRWLLGESVVLDTAGRRQALQHLMEWTDLTPDEIGSRLGIDGDSASRSWERIIQRARAADGPVPWRRVYVASVAEDRPKRAGDMGQAA